MAKQYGIRTYEEDNTPWFRSSDEWDTWFASQDERDSKYGYLITPNPFRFDKIKQLTYSYAKIERDVANS